MRTADKLDQIKQFNGYLSQFCHNHGYDVTSRWCCMYRRVKKPWYHKIDNYFLQFSDARLTSHSQIRCFDRLINVLDTSFTAQDKALFQQFFNRKQLPALSDQISKVRASADSASVSTGLLAQAAGRLRLYK